MTSRRKRSAFTFLLTWALLQNAAWPSWTVSLPSANSTRTKSDDVAGAGMTSNQNDGDEALFIWWYLDSESMPHTEDQEMVETDVMMGAGSWSHTFEPDPYWTVSPMGPMSMRIGDHNATIRWGDPPVEHGTAGHVVNP